MTTNFFVTATDTLGCESDDSILVIVNSLPLIDAGPDTSVCIGESVGLSATGAASYVWDPSPALSCTSCQQPVASPALTQTFYLTGTDNNGCQNRDSVMVIVNPLPIPTLSQDTSMCLGDSALQITASGGIGYLWTPSIGLSCLLCPNPFALPSQTTTYNVSVTDQNGCSNFDSLTITVNQISIATSADTSICSGISIPISAFGAASYLWSPAVGLNDPSISNPIATPLQPTMYYVDGIGQNGCSDKDSVFVDVYAAPNIIISADTTLCAGDSYQMIANGTASYSWAPSNGLNCTNCPNPLATPLSSTVYFVTGTDQFGCSTTDSVRITVNALPVITISSDTSICSGDSALLLAQGGINYNWAPFSFLSNPSISNPIAKPTSSIQYHVTVSDISGCANEDSVFITVNPLPTAGAGADISLCRGDSTQLLASGGTQYLWIPANLLSCSTCPDPFTRTTTTTTYRVIATDLNGCSDDDEITVIVNNLPNVITTGGVAICSGDSAVISASGANSYSWTPVTGLSDPLLPVTTASPGSTITYTITGTNGIGCLDTAHLQVKVDPLPNVDAGIDMSICEGDSAALSANGAASYLWEPTIGLSCTACPNPFASPTITTTYHLEGSDLAGCKGYDSLTITVLPLPSIDAGTDQTLNQGESVMLVGSGGSTYNWTPAAGLSNPSVYNPVASPSTTTIYYLTGYDALGCSGLDSVTISVVHEIYVANAFSPNGDGVNDMFSIDHNQGLELITFAIYNRWGELVFITDDISIGWNGNLKNNPQPIGIYVYIIHGNDLDGQPVTTTGNLTLLR